MRYAFAVLAVLTVTCVLSAAAEPVYVLSNGKVSALVPEVAFTSPVSSAPPSACYVDAFGRTVCPAPSSATTWGPVSMVPVTTWGPTTAASANCPCVTANGSCPCTNANLPMPMAGPGWSYSLATRAFTPLRDVVEAQPVRSMFRSFFNAVQQRPRLTFVR